MCWQSAHNLSPNRSCSFSFIFSTTVRTPFLRVNAFAFTLCFFPLLILTKLYILVGHFCYHRLMRAPDLLV